ncbi:glycosyltransferase [Enterococcus ratti]|uniref:glycosyltransferase n=1 Tax=Enterococcus ratti TaxID=150033 RepID=UPI0035199646
MKKKVLLISESMAGGLRKHLIQLIEYLDQNKFEIYFIHGTDKADSCFMNQYEKLKKLATVIPCPTFTRNLHFKNDFATYQFLNQQIKIIQPDIVHCHSSKAGALGRVAAKRNHIDRIFYTPHAYSFLSPEFKPLKKKVFVWIERLLSKYATKMTFNVSEEEKTAAINLHLDRSAKFAVIHNGLPEIVLPSKKEVKESLGLKETNIVVGNNARLSFQKDPFLFMEIAKEVIQQNDNYHFVWAGDGPLFKEVNDFLIENSLTQNVHLLGERTDSEQIVAGYDRYLITSKYEGLPYSLIEAIRAGVPIIGKKVTGVEEIISQISGGRLLNTKDPKRFAQEILNEAQTYDKNQIIEVYQKNYSLNQMIQKITTYYQGES